MSEELDYKKLVLCMQLLRQQQRQQQLMLTQLEQLSTGSTRPHVSVTMQPEASNTYANVSMSSFHEQLLSKAKCQYSHLWDARTNTEDGLRELQKHIEDGTVPHSMRLKLFKIRSPSIDYSSIFSLPSDFNVTRIDPVKAHIKARNDELKEDLLNYQRQLIRRCITDKEYHLGHLNTALDSYDIDVSNKWRRQLLGPEQYGNMIVQTMLTFFRRWKADFMSRRKNSYDEIVLMKKKTAQRKATAEALLNEKFSNMTKVQFVAEMVKLCQSKTEQLNKPFSHKEHGKCTGGKRATNALLTQRGKATGKKTGRDIRRTY